MTQSVHSPIAQELEGVISTTAHDPCIVWIAHFQPCACLVVFSGSNCTNVQSEGRGSLPRRDHTIILLYSNFLYWHENNYFEPKILILHI